MNQLTERQRLIRINNLLEQAVRESLQLEMPHLLDVQIGRIRADLNDRIYHALQAERAAKENA